MAVIRGDIAATGLFLPFYLSLYVLQERQCWEENVAVFLFSKTIQLCLCWYFVKIGNNISLVNIENLKLWNPGNNISSVEIVKVGNNIGLVKLISDSCTPLLWLLLLKPSDQRPAAVNIANTVCTKHFLLVHKILFLKITQNTFACSQTTFFENYTKYFCLFTNYLFLEITRNTFACSQTTFFWKLHEILLANSTKYF